MKVGKGPNLEGVNQHETFSRKPWGAFPDIRRNRFLDAWNKHQGLQHTDSGTEIGKEEQKIKQSKGQLPSWLQTTLTWQIFGELLWGTAQNWVEETQCWSRQRWYLLPIRNTDTSRYRMTSCKNAILYKLVSYEKRKRSGKRLVLLSLAWRENICDYMDCWG